MIKICIILSAILAGASVYYNRRDDHKADAALFAAYAVVIFGAAVTWGGLRGI